MNPMPQGVGPSPGSSLVPGPDWDLGEQFRAAIEAVDAQPRSATPDADMGEDESPDKDLLTLADVITDVFAKQEREIVFVSYSAVSPLPLPAAISPTAPKGIPEGCSNAEKVPAEPRKEAQGLRFPVPAQSSGFQVPTKLAPDCDATPAVCDPILGIEWGFHTTNAWQLPQQPPLNPNTHGLWYSQPSCEQCLGVPSAQQVPGRFPSQLLQGIYPGPTGRYPTTDYSHGGFLTGSYTSRGHPSGGSPTGAYTSGGYPSGEYANWRYTDGRYTNGRYPTGVYLIGGYPTMNGGYTMNNTYPLTPAVSMPSPVIPVAQGVSTARNAVTTENQPIKGVLSGQYGHQGVQQPGQGKQM